VISAAPIATHTTIRDDTNRIRTPAFFGPYAPTRGRGLMEIGGTFGGTIGSSAAGSGRSVFELGADGRIRTGDPLFTNQAAIEFSTEFSLCMYSQGFH
jgi:hypothetical protein